MHCLLLPEACDVGSIDGEKKKEGELPLVEDPIGHLTLKQLFLWESKQETMDDGEDTTTPSLARLFYSKFQSELGGIACTSNRAAFVLSALIPVPSVKEEVREALKGSEKRISLFL